MMFINFPGRDQWGFLGLAIMVGTSLFVPSMLGRVDDTLARFMLLQVIVAVSAGCMVLTQLKGPRDQGQPFPTRRRWTS